MFFVDHGSPSIIVTSLPHLQSLPAAVYSKSASRSLFSSNSDPTHHTDLSQNTQHSLSSITAGADSSRYNSLWHCSPVSQLLASAPTDSTSNTQTLLASPSKRKRDESTTSSYAHSQSTPSTTMKALNINYTETSEVSQEGAVDCESASIFEGLEATDISMTSDFNDCIRILHKAEKSQQKKLFD